MAAQIEVAAMGDAFEFAEIAGCQEGEGVFDIRGTAGIMTQFLGMMIA